MIRSITKMTFQNFVVVPLMIPMICLYIIDLHGCVL